MELDILQEEHIKDTLHAYQIAKRCNEKRVMAQAVEWGKRGARLNAIAPGIIVTPSGRPGTADEIANIAELLMSDRGSFITGSTFLADGGATAAYYYGDLKN